MSKSKVWEKKSFWLILLGILCLAIIGLGVGIAINNVKNSEKINDVISEIEQSYSDDLLSTNGALVFYDFMIEKRDSGILSNEDIYSYYEDILNKVSGETKLSYLIYYANFFFDDELDLDGAVSILKRFESEVENNVAYKIDYYAGLSNLYLRGGDTDQSEYYNELLRELSPSDEVYDIEDEEDMTVINEGLYEDNR